MPDLILLDIRLENSGQNGIAICTRLKSQPATKDLPVLLLSAEEGLAELSRSCGADGWISKPFEIARLTHTVQQLIYRV